MSSTARAVPAPDPGADLAPDPAPDPACSAVAEVISIRPQILLYVLFGDYLATQDLRVATSSLLEVTGRIGVGEHALRTTLARMNRHGSLTRSVRGRRAYFGLTDAGRRTVLAGRDRALHTDVVTRDWDGTWTLVAFSLPGDLGRRRHDLRVRLGYAGFGVAQGGLWVAPRRVDVSAVLMDLGLADRIRGFESRALPATDLLQMVAEAYPLDTLASGYAEFHRRWSRAGALTPVDPLARRTLLAADWSRVVRFDPRLPVQLLPADWPAQRAHELFQRLQDQLREPSEAAARAELDTLPPE